VRFLLSRYVLPQQAATILGLGGLGTIGSGTRK
jgi:hypothetical protein